MDDILEAVDRCIHEGDLKRAEILIARLLRSASNSGDRVKVLLRRARVRLLAERPDDALEDIQTCCLLQPDALQDPVILELMGDIHFARFELSPIGFADRSDVDQALECYNKLIASRPDHPHLGWILYQKGRILLSQSEVEASKAMFHQAIGHPGHLVSLPALCYERLGFIELFEKRNPEQALVFFAQAVDAYPVGENAGWLVQLHILRSRALREQKLYVEAWAAARQALSTIDATAPDYRRALPEAHLAVGEALAHINGRESEAIDHLVQFLQLSRRPLGVDVTWSRIYETMGELSFRLEGYEQAIDAYTNALSFNPYHPLATTLYYQIARCHYRMRAYEKTIDTLERMQRTAAADGEPVRDYHVFNVLGNAYFALEQYGRAASAYREALSLAPAGAEQLDKIRTYLHFSEELSSQS